MRGVVGVWMGVEGIGGCMGVGWVKKVWWQEWVCGMWVVGVWLFEVWVRGCR